MVGAVFGQFGRIDEDMFRAIDAVTIGQLGQIATRFHQMIKKPVTAAGEFIAMQIRAHQPQDALRHGGAPGNVVEHLTRVIGLRLHPMLDFRVAQIFHIAIIIDHRRAEIRIGHGTYGRHRGSIGRPCGARCGE